MLVEVPCRGDTRFRGWSNLSVDPHMAVLTSVYISEYGHLALEYGHLALEYGHLALYLALFSTV